MGENPAHEAAAADAEADLLLSGRTLTTAQIMFHTQVAEVLGLSLSDYRCLEAVLRSAGPVTAGALADLSGLTTGAVTGVIDRLERAGYVNRVRDAADRRRVLVRAVDGAFDQYRWIFDSLTARLEELAGGFTKDELDTVRRYLRLVGDVMRTETVALHEGRQTAQVRGRRSG